MRRDMISGRDGDIRRENVSNALHNGFDKSLWRVFRFTGGKSLYLKTHYKVSAGVYAVNIDVAMWERKKESMKIGHIVQLRKYSVVRFA